MKAFALGILATVVVAQKNTWSYTESYFEEAEFSLASGSFSLLIGTDADDSFKLYQHDSYAYNKVYLFLKDELEEGDLAAAWICFENLCSIMTWDVEQASLWQAVMPMEILAPAEAFEWWGDPRTVDQMEMDCPDPYKDIESGQMTSLYQKKSGIIYNQNCNHDACRLNIVTIGDSVVNTDPETGVEELSTPLFSQIARSSITTVEKDKVRDREEQNEE